MKNDIFFKKHLENIFLQKATENAQHIFIELELTGKCNNRCFFCGNDSGLSNHELDYDVITKFIQTNARHFYSRGKTPLFSLCGGDPVLYTQFHELLLFLSHNRLNFIFKGNPSTLDYQAAAELKTHGCKGVKFTFLGEEGLHNSVRKNDSVQDLIQKTKLFQSLRIPVVWNLTTGKFNFSSLIDSLPLIHDVRPDAITIGRLANIGRFKQKDSDEPMTPQEFHWFLKKLLEYYYKNYLNGFHLSFKEKLWVPLLGENELIDFTQISSAPLQLGCDAYERALNLNYRGEVSRCGLFFGSQTYPVEEFQIENRTHLGALCVGKNGSCRGCKYENYCQGCRASALASTGDLYGKDPQCWIGPMAATVGAGK